ncbi:ligand-binding sensor domain-containing protein [Pseudochryseolinea flava]|nr:two-component regulator propeller domain-containing protein [Pseudochryseolinea flava]
MRFDHFGVEQGLSQGNAAAAYQDRYGFIWIGTEDGLNLYDGYSFTVFRNDPRDSTSISNNNVKWITQDQSGNIWLATLGGLNMYDRNKNQFTRFLYDSLDANSLTSNEVTFVFFDSKKRLWVSTGAGLNLYDSAINGFKHFLPVAGQPNRIAGKIVRHVLEDHQHRLWVATDGGVSMLNSDENTFTTYAHDPTNPRSLSSNNLISLYEDQSNSLWVGTFDTGLNKLNPQDGTVTRYQHNPADPTSLGNNYIYAIAQDASGALWLATDGALAKMNANGTFTNYRKVEGDETTLSSNIITGIYFDNDQRMWASTRFGGINVYDKGKFGFPHIRHLNHDPYSIANNTVTNYVEDQQGQLYISMDGGGINRLDRETGRYLAVAKGLFSNDKVLAIEFDNNGELWAGNWADGLHRFDPKTNKTRHYLHDPSNPRSLSDNNIFDLLKDNDGNIWIATYGRGLNRYNTATDDFTRYVNDPSNPQSIPASPLGFLYQDRQGMIWIATERNGLIIMDPRTETFQFIRATGKPGGLSSNAIFVIFEDSKNRVWIGTDGGGLNRYDRKTKTFEAYRTHDGLPNDAVVGILEDGQQQLWLSTNKGLSRFNPEKKTFKNFTVSDGLQGNQFTRWSFYKTTRGELIFGGTNGFNMFDPSAIKGNEKKPPVYITDFRLFNKPVPIGEKEILKQHILFTKDIRLSYEENIFSFEFTALNYRQPEKNRYQYIMEGFQDEWIDAGNERKVSYTNLSPGEYTFRVRASNNDGVWNEEGASIHITIVPPFWKTWWFNTLLVVSIVGGAIWLFRYQRRKAKRQQAELKAIIEEQTSEVKKQNAEIIKKAEQEKIQAWISEGIAHISDVISKQKGSLNEFSHEVLKALLKYVRAQQGVMTVVNREDPSDEHLEVLATYGVNREHKKHERIEIGAGLIGASYKDGERKIVTNIPTDYLKITSGLGEATPARLLLLPLRTDDGDILGVVEIAFLTEITATVTEFLDKVSSVIALNIHAVNLSHKTTLLLQQAKEQTEELRAQEEEMRQNMEELEATQEEFRRREFEFQKRIEQLEEALRRKE